MARDLRLADPQNLNEKTDADFPAGNEVEKAQPGGIGQGAKQKIDRERLVFLRHAQVNYIRLDRYEQDA